ncbi:DUF1465 family protein [Novosphingobium nitrogenifigens]|uniref:DUF1465 family protein n=1 Tax=Novosphingobium nitrogenifigens TaxID=378548 RepID=UPI000A99B30B|nr:DUF1465 family protein [Novosphingobium nitrogenifigens]
MSRVVSLSQRLVESLYGEALVLAENTRTRFEQVREDASPERLQAVSSGQPPRAHGVDSVEIMCEALRTTTRVMHCLAWLLNYRSWFAGELSAVQLRCHGRLITHFPASDPSIVARLPDDLAGFVRQSERLYERIQRLELALRQDLTEAVGAIARLRERLSYETARHA